MNNLLLLLFVPFSLLAQIGPNNTVSGNNVLFSGTVYLDSVAIDINKTFLDPDNIQSISFGVAWQDSIQGAPRAVYISRKVQTELVTLQKVKSDIINSSESLKNEPVVNVVIEGRVIEHPETYFIETTAIVKIDVIISSPESKNSHLWRTPSIAITVKASK